MQEMQLYEYAVIRLVPRIEREEFINVGVILFCKRAKYLKIKYEINKNKFEILFPDADIEYFYCHLDAFDKICNGNKEYGPIAQLDIAERFRWITAPKSTTLQTSRPHPGFTDNPDDTLACLFDELVS